MSKRYSLEYEKALSFLKKLEIDKALSIFYHLLKINPTDIDLIRQIYQLETRKRPSKGLNQITRHIFAQQHKGEDFHKTAIACYREVKQRFGLEYFNSFEPDAMLNLIFHLGKTSFQEDIELSSFKFTIGVGFG